MCAELSARQKMMDSLLWSDNRNSGWHNVMVGLLVNTLICVLFYFVQDLECKLLIDKE